VTTFAFFGTLNIIIIVVVITVTVVTVVVSVVHVISTRGELSVKSLLGLIRGRNNNSR
jgi:hypothetical protein